MPALDVTQASTDSTQESDQSIVVAVPPGEEVTDLPKLQVVTTGLFTVELYCSVHASCRFDLCLAERQCQQCHEQAYKYACPACSYTSCSLSCSKAHKQKTGCTGKRSRTEMVTLSDFTERQLLSDYKFLEEASRLHDSAQRSEVPRPARQLPMGLQQFVDEVCHQS